MEIKKILSMILVLGLLGGIALGGYVFINNQTEKKKGELEKETRRIEEGGVPLASPKSRKIDLPERPETEKKASFYLEADKEEYTTGEVFNLRVMVNGNNEVVDGAEFVLNYDPELVSVGELITTPFFSLYPQKKTDSEKGTVRVIGLQSPDENKTLNQETMATLPITTLKPGTLKLDFDLKRTHIAAYGGQELLEEAEGLELGIR